MERRAVAPALALALIAAVASCGRPGREGPATRVDLSRPGLSAAGPVDEGKVVAGQSIYVPAWSHVATGDGGQALDLATTLYVRNVDPERPIVLVRARYVDSSGKAVREFLGSPVRVGPLASVEFFVREGDATGGSAPSFLVEWVAEQAVADPVAESVMIGTAGTQGISFTGQGRVVRSRRP